MDNCTGIIAVLTITVVALIVLRVVSEKITNVSEGFMNSYEPAPFDNSGDDDVRRNEPTVDTRPHGDDFKTDFAGQYQSYKKQVVDSIPTLNQIDGTGHTRFSIEQQLLSSQDSILSPASINTSTFGTSGGYASSLLPSPGDDNDVFKGFNDVESDNTLAHQAFLEPSQMIGVNTVAGSNKNANVGLRSECPNPILNVSVWNNSSTYPDLTRRPFEQCEC